MALALLALARSRPDRAAAAPAATPMGGLSASPTAGRVSVQQIAGPTAPGPGTVWHSAPQPVQGGQPTAVTTVAMTAPPPAGSSGAAAPAPAERSAEPGLPVVAGGQVTGITALAEALTGRRVRVLAEGSGGQVRGVLAAVVGNLLILCDDDRVIWVKLPDVQAIATGPGIGAGRGVGGGSGSLPTDAAHAPAQGAEVNADAGPIAPEGAALQPEDPDAVLPEPTDGGGDARTGRRADGGPGDPIARVLWPPTWELVSVYRGRI